MPQTCLIIPCYNEAGRLAMSAFENFLLTEKEFALCFVDDGSTDQTFNLLQTAEVKFPGRVFLIKMEHNCGKAEAVRKGVIEMFETNRYEYIGYFDADLSAPLPVAKDFVTILESKKHLKIIFGSRINKKGVVIKKNYLRHLAGRCFSFVVNHYFSINLYDTQCGAKVFRREMAPLIFKYPFVSRWLFDIEIILRLDDNAVLQEEPVSQWINKKGSKIKFVDLLKLPAEMKKIKQGRRGV